MYVSLSNQILRKRLKNKIPISLPNYINCTVVIRKTLESQTIAKKKSKYTGQAFLSQKIIKKKQNFVLASTLKTL